MFSIKLLQKKEEVPLSGVPEGLIQHVEGLQDRL